MDRIKGIIDTLKVLYPSPKSELNFNNNFELIVAVILSAQCTDKRVNMVTKSLFSVCPSPESLASIPIEELEQIIKPCGFYHSKAKNLKAMALDLCKKFNGVVPSDKSQLKTLAGVGEKTANVVLIAGFSVPAIPVDTHMFRVSNRLGLANHNTVLGTQKQLEQILPEDFWIDGHHAIILHGRYVCRARKPDCASCKLKKYCRYYEENIYNLTKQK